MRVIAGLAKGRRLRTVSGFGVRPSGDRLKEGLFSSLATVVGGARVLDLFAGSGALGIEALSRGAEFATFVEKDARVAEMIEANLEATGFSERALVVVQPAEAFLAMTNKVSYDLVLIDPPYAVGLPSEVLYALSDKGWLSDGGLVVAEVSSRNLPVDVPGGFGLEKEKRYGDSALIFLRPEAKASD